MASSSDKSFNRLDSETDDLYRTGLISGRTSVGDSMPYVIQDVSQYRPDENGECDHVDVGLSECYQCLSNKSTEEGDLYDVEHNPLFEEQPILQKSRTPSMKSRTPSFEVPKLSFSNLLSPSAAFSKSRLSCCVSSLVHAILLSQWDNILGPRVRHIWTVPETDALQLNLLNKISSRTLSGEICRDPDTATVDVRFYELSEYNIAVTAWIFGARDSKREMSVHCLSLLTPLVNLPDFLHTHPLPHTHIQHSVGKLRVLLDKNCIEDALEVVGVDLTLLVNTMESLKQHGLPLQQSINISNTHLCPSHPIDEHFLRRAIASHLTTCGHTVVVGDNANAINTMIHTLALFLSISERHRSRLISEDNTHTYHPGICLQGSMKKNGFTDPSIKDIVLSISPVTLVDLSSLEVRQSPMSHRAHRQEMLTEELRSLWNSFCTPAYSTRTIFTSFDDSETLVRDFLEELRLLPQHGGACEVYIKHFIKLLQQKATLLIRYVQPDGRSDGARGRMSEKKVRTDLNLGNPADFRIVLATAERLKPGITAYLCKDAWSDADILDSF